MIHRCPTGEASGGRSLKMILKARIAHRRFVRVSLQCHCFSSLAPRSQKMLPTTIERISSNFPKHIPHPSQIHSKSMSSTCSNHPNTCRNHTKISRKSYPNHPNITPTSCENQGPVCLTVWDTLWAPRAQVCLGPNLGPWAPGWHANLVNRRDWPVVLGLGLSCNLVFQ